MEALTAYVLAGGQSSRMGRDKAFLEVSGRSLLANALGLARSVSGKVRIVGDPAKLSALGTVVPDVYIDRGPLGGIHAALASSEADLNLIIGVDLPFLEPRFLRYLVSQAERGGALVTVPKVGGYYEPLCAVYRKEFGALADKALAANCNKVDALFSGAPLCMVNDEALARNGFSAAMFRNVNTPADWRQALEEFDRRQHV
jgi:molybdopterin-guanine dinucleotide biosynthesis protein A